MLHDIHADAQKYIGKEVSLFPDGTNPRTAVIEDLDAVGWTFRLTSINGNVHDKRVGDLMFYPHSRTALYFRLNNPGPKFEVKCVADRSPAAPGLPDGAGPTPAMLGEACTECPLY